MRFLRAVSLPVRGIAISDVTNWDNADRLDCAGTGAKSPEGKHSSLFCPQCISALGSTARPSLLHVQVLDIKTESAEVLLSLAALSGSYHVQSSASRRQLKADIEEQGITNFEHFLSVAGVVISVRTTRIHVQL